MKTLPIISVVIMAITIAVACDSDSEPQPKEIAFTEYSLLGTDCEWIQPENSNDVELVIIERNEKLNNYIQSPTGKSRPAVDFSKCSLLLARGVCLYYTCPDRINLNRFSNESYVMTVNLMPSVVSVITPWQTAIIVDKAVIKGNVKLQITADPQK